MENNIGQQGVPSPALPPVHEEALKKIRMIAGEHFDSFVIVLGKSGQRWSTWNDDTAAFGMASFVCHKINQKWWNEKEADVK